MSLRLLSLLTATAALAACPSPATEPADDLVRIALEAEARLDTHTALDRFLAAERLRPDEPFILKKISRQYSDAVEDAASAEEKRRLAGLALDYAQRAYDLEPADAEIVLSVAICHGKLALFSDTRAKLVHSRLVKDYAEEALSVDPDYDWAHHVLGRWHHEVASLGGATRFFANLIYGGLPDASPDAAIRHLERAVALGPDVRAHHLELGFAYVAAGRTADARRSFERGLALPIRAKHDANARQRAQEALDRLAR